MKPCLHDVEDTPVTLADLDDNTDPARTAQLAPATRQRLAVKYTHARSVLSGN